MRTRHVLSLCAAAVAIAGPVWAQEAKSEPSFLLELNSLQASEKGCRLTFVVTNDLGAELKHAAFEIALFDAAGVVDRLTVLDFTDLPPGKTKVSRFDLAGAECDRISRVLVNGVTDCEGAGVEANACMRRLKTKSRAAVAFGV